jgi:zinc protease
MFFLKDDLPFALDRLEQFVKTPAFDQSMIDREREQMLTAIASRKDSVMQTASKELMETLFLKHPFRRDGLGTEESLKKITRNDVVAYFERFIAPRNMVVSVFGDIDKAAVLKDLERRFGSLPPKSVELKTFDEPAPEALRLKELTMDKEQAAVLYGFRAPVISSDDSYTIEIAVNILSSSLGGRMFKRIRDELGKAYTLGGVYQPGVDAGLTVFYVLTTNENIDRVRAIMDEEFARLAKEPVSDKELADAKVYLKGDRARDLETIPSQSSTVVIDEALGLGYDHYRAYDQKIDAVTARGIQDAAVKFFDTRQAAVVVVQGRKPVRK